LSGVRDVLECPECGHEELGQATQCSECGATLPFRTMIDVPAIGAATLRACADCGAKLPTLAGRCPVCGLSIELDPDEAQTVVAGKDDPRIRSLRAPLPSEPKLSAGQQSTNTQIKAVFADARLQESADAGAADQPPRDRGATELLAHRLSEEDLQETVGRASTPGGLARRPGSTPRARAESDPFAEPDFGVTLPDSVQMAPDDESEDAQEFIPTFATLSPLQPPAAPPPAAEPPGVQPAKEKPVDPFAETDVRLSLPDTVRLPPDVELADEQEFIPTFATPSPLQPSAATPPATKYPGRQRAKEKRVAKSRPPAASESDPFAEPELSLTLPDSVYMAPDDEPEDEQELIPTFAAPSPLQPRAATPPAREPPGKQQPAKEKRATKKTTRRRPQNRTPSKERKE
jgi:hypothetical protein